MFRPLRQLVPDLFVESRAFIGAQRGRLDNATAQAWASSIHDEKLRQILLNQLR